MVTALIDLMGAYHQAGNLPQMAAIARSILTAVPDDLVALQFLGLALYQMGRIEAARRVFSRVCAIRARKQPSELETTGEMAGATIYREARAPASGLSDAWQQVAHAMSKLGFRVAANQAYAMSLAAKGLVLQTGTVIMGISERGIRRDKGPRR
jgi:tetratricopeptide (TPR) repeat protein